MIQAFYAASDGGHTDSVEDVWHGGNPAYKIPWLTGVCDPGESTGANPWTDWTQVLHRRRRDRRGSRPYTGLDRHDPAVPLDPARGEGAASCRAVAVGSSGSATGSTAPR